MCVITCIIINGGSPHGYWNRIHWIRIPDPDSMWCCVSSARHADYTRIALLDWNSHTLLRALSRSTARIGSRPCGGKVVFESRSLICIGFGSKVLCGVPHYHNSYTILIIGAFSVMCMSITIPPPLAAIDHHVNELWLFSVFLDCAGYQQQFCFKLVAMNILNMWFNFINLSRSNIKL